MAQITSELGENNVCEKWTEIQDGDHIVKIWGIIREQVCSLFHVKVSSTF